MKYKLKKPIEARKHEANRNEYVIFMNDHRALILDKVTFEELFEPVDTKEEQP